MFYSLDIGGDMSKASLLNPTSMGNLFSSMGSEKGSSLLIVECLYHNLVVYFYPLP